MAEVESAPAMAGRIFKFAPVYTSRAYEYWDIKGTDFVKVSDGGDFFRIKGAVSQEVASLVRFKDDALDAFHVHASDILDRDVEGVAGGYALSGGVFKLVQHHIEIAGMVQHYKGLQVEYSSGNHYYIQSEAQLCTYRNQFIFLQPGVVDAFVESFQNLGAAYAVESTIMRTAKNESFTIDQVKFLLSKAPHLMRIGDLRLSTDDELDDLLAAPEVIGHLSSLTFEGLELDDSRFVPLFRNALYLTEVHFRNCEYVGSCLLKLSQILPQAFERIHIFGVKVDALSLDLIGVFTNLAPQIEVMRLEGLLDFSEFLMKLTGKALPKLKYLEMSAELTGAQRKRLSAIAPKLEEVSLIPSSMVKSARKR